MLTRRTLLLSGAAAALPWPAMSAGAEAAEDRRLAAMLQRHADLYWRSAPEAATGLALDTGAHAALRGQLRARSAAQVARDRTAVGLGRAELAGIARANLSATGRRDHDVAAFVYDNLADLLGRYGTVDLNLRPSPYVVSQMNGAYYWLPGFIGGGHPIESRSDVDAYHSRLAALGKVLDDETDRIRRDAAAGVVPPSFIIERTVAQIARLRDTAPAQNSLVEPAVARAAARGLGDIAPQATAIFRSAVAPGLTRQMEALEALRSQAEDTAGVWRLPDGEAYYRAALRSNTTLGHDPGELHRNGLEQVASLSARLDGLLKAQGLSTGTVGERIAALDRDPRFLVSDDDAGRAALLDAAGRHLAAITTLLPRAFRSAPIQPLEVRRMSPAIEDSSPGAFYSGGAAGGPGVYALNLKRPHDHPLWRLPTLTHHEGIPGHHYQSSIEDSAGALPVYRRLVGFSAYTEGWALYAEQLADELGVYESNPAGRIGLIQSQLFRAARIVVDTGIHHQRWTREGAISWMVEHAGEARAPAEREIDRYCVYPGQACSFMVGANTIMAVREAARHRLGARFDLPAFHDLVLRSGPVPMEILETMAEEWDGS